MATRPTAGGVADRRPVAANAVAGVPLMRMGIARTRRAVAAIGLLCALALLPTPGTRGLTGEPAPSSAAAVLLVASRARGDCALVDHTVLQEYVQRKRSGETDEPEKAWSSIDRFRYREDVEAATPGGVAERVARRYDVATTHTVLEGASPTDWKWSLPGHRFRVSRGAGNPVIEGPVRLGGSETRELEAALVDRAAPYLPGRSCAIGQVWPLADNAMQAYFTSSHTIGNCRLEAITQYKGQPCAHIVGRASTTAVDHRGRRLALQMNIELRWSLALRRPLAITVDADSQVDSTTSQGATIVTEHLVGRVVVRHTCTWVAVAGRPVKPF